MKIVSNSQFQALKLSEQMCQVWCLLRIWWGGWFIIKFSVVSYRQQVGTLQLRRDYTQLAIFCWQNETLSIICLLSCRNVKYLENCRLWHCVCPLPTDQTRDDENYFKNVREMRRGQRSLLSLSVYILVLTPQFVELQTAVSITNDPLQYLHIASWHLHIIKVDILTLYFHRQNILL